MTTDLPTKEGHYWWMARGKDFDTLKSIQRVYQNRDGEYYVEYSGRRRLVGDWPEDEAQYWQYIPEPKTP